MQIGVYSEQPDVLNEVVSHLEVYFEYCCAPCDIYGFSTYQEMVQTLNEMQFQIFVINLDMVREECWGVVDFIHYIDENCAIILLSSSIENAVRGYQAEACDYLLQPLNREAFSAAIARVIKKYNLLSRCDELIKLKVDGVWTQVLMDKIAYVESSGHSLIFSMINKEEVKIAASFRDYSPLLDRAQNFFRCHKSFVVNLNCVLEMNPTCFTLVDGRKVNISRKYKQKSKAYYINYVMDKYFEAGEG